MRKLGNLVRRAEYRRAPIKAFPDILKDLKRETAPMYSAAYSTADFIDKVIERDGEELDPDYIRSLEELQKVLEGAIDDIDGIFREMRKY